MLTEVQEFVLVSCKRITAYRYKFLYPSGLACARDQAREYARPRVRAPARE